MRIAANGDHVLREAVSLDQLSEEAHFQHEHLVHEILPFRRVSQLGSASRPAPSSSNGCLRNNGGTIDLRDY